jgi:MFS family permease
MMGVGSGSLGVTRSFVVEQCEPKKRTETLAFLTALQYAGFTVSPIIGSWLSSIGQYICYLRPGLNIYLICIFIVSPIVGT